MTSTSSQGSTGITLQFALYAQHRRGRAGRAGDDRQGCSAICRNTLPYPPSYQKVNPADQPVLYLSLLLADHARFPTSTSTPRRPWRSASRWSAAWPRSASTARRSIRRARPARPARWPAAQIGIDEVANAIQQGQRQPADRHALRRAAGYHRPSRTASSDDAEEYRPLIVAYRNGAPCGWPTSAT